MMIRCLTFVLMFAATAVPTIGISAETIPAAADPLADNAALVYWAAFSLMPQPEGDERIDEDAPIDEELIKFVDKGKAAMHELCRATKMDRCVWGIEFEAGIEAQLTHLSKARDMARFACLTARVRFHQDRADEAIEDLTEVITMARHAGSDGLLISLLVQYAIEDLAIEALAEQLPALQPEQLDRIAEIIDALPDSLTMSHAMHSEKALLLEWFIGRLSQPEGKEEILNMLKGQLQGVTEEDVARYNAVGQQEMLDGLISLRPIYDELAEVLKKSPEEVEEVFENLIEKRKLEGPAKMFASFMLPAVGKVRRSEAAHETQLLMFRAAVAVAGKDRSQLDRDELRDPYGDGSFEYTKTADGFTLRSKLLDRKGNPVVLSIGPSSDE